MMWELGLTYQDENVEQVVLESVPPCTWFDYGHNQVSEAPNSYQGLNTFSASVRSNKFFFTSPSITAAMMVSASESLWDCEPSTFPPLRYPPPSRTDPPPTHTLTINAFTLAYSIHTYPKHNIHNIPALLLGNNKWSSDIEGQTNTSPHFIYVYSLDKALRLSISIVIWILSSDTDNCQLNQFNTNSEAAMLSNIRIQYMMEV